jgi:hypothetical protein
MLFYYQRTLSKNRFRLFGVITFLIVLKYFLNGFEFITSYLCAIVVPIFYFEITSWRPQYFFKHMFLVCAATVTGILTALLLLYLQISMDTDFTFAQEHIIYSFTKRSNGFLEHHLESVYNYALNVSAFDVIHDYLRKPVFPMPFNTFNFNYYLLLLLNTIAGTVLFVKKDPRIKLFYSSMLAFAGSMVWFMIFKGHAVNHHHLDELALHIIWVPFAIVSISTVLTQPLKTDTGKAKSLFTP